MIVRLRGKWQIHSGNKVIGCKIPGEWKIQLTVALNFIFSKDFNEARTMHSKVIMWKL